MSNLLTLVNPGHGAVARIYPGLSERPFEIPMTDGKRSAQIPPGQYEGILNREISTQIIEAGSEYTDLKFLNLAPGFVDIRKGDRVKAGNRIYKEIRNQYTPIKDVIWTGIHCNASGKSGWDESAKGFVIWCHPLSKKSKFLAEMIHHNLSLRLAGLIDGKRGIRYSRHLYELCATHMTAVIVEGGFMTSREEVAKLKNKEIQKRIGAGVVGGLVDYKTFGE